MFYFPSLFQGGMNSTELETRFPSLISSSTLIMIIMIMEVMLKNNEDDDNKDVDKMKMVMLC